MKLSILKSLSGIILYQRLNISDSFIKMFRSIEALFAISTSLAFSIERNDGELKSQSNFGESTY